jgi:hypothetical protein
MKNIKYIIAICAAVFISSCKTGDDLYDSPNSPAEIGPALALTSIEVNTIMNTEGDFARTAAVLTQQMAGSSGYAALQNYQLVTNDFNNHWNGLYSGTMYNAKLMIDKYSANNPYYAGMAKVLMAINLSIATDFFGDVPYSDAFQGNKYYFASKYDKQQDIYISIQALLDAAIADFGKPASANVNLPATDDIYYSGKIPQWTAAAWTLKARFANRLSLKDPQGSATKVLDYLTKGITTAANNMENKHDDSNSPNQWADFQFNRPGYLLANKRFFDVLSANSDPRLDYYFKKTATGDFVGADISVSTINTKAAIMGSYFDYAESYGLVTFHEAKFLEAEAKFRLGQAATTALNDGIKASVAYVTKGEDDGSSIATYVPGTTNLTSIMTEKWKAMFGHIEVYNDWRRTGLPALTPRPQSAGAVVGYIVKRLPTPTTESDNNPNAKFVALDQPVWWAGGN